jgi:hypothetical protein
MTYYPTRIDVPPEVQVEVIDLLNQTLATSLDTKLRSNVVDSKRRGGRGSKGSRGRESYLFECNSV